jgi:hypothetical protein
MLWQKTHARLDVIWKDLSVLVDVQFLLMLRQKTRENCGQEICGFFTWRKSAKWFILTLVSPVVVVHAGRRGFI